MGGDIPDIRTLRPETEVVQGDSRTLGIIGPGVRAAPKSVHKFNAYSTVFILIQVNESKQVQTVWLKSLKYDMDINPKFEGSRRS